MRDFLCSSSYFGLAATILAYWAGLSVKKITGKSWANPLLIGIAILIVFTRLMGISSDEFNASGASIISYLLTPCTVSLAIPLYRQIEAIKRNPAAILGGICSGVAACMVTIPILSVLLGCTHEQYVSMLSKSITTAIGMGVTAEMGGYVSITIVSIYFTGIFGNVMADTFCKLFRITEPVARGIAIGTSSHAMGTARAFEMGEVEGAMSSLSIAITGIITAIVVPFMAGVI